MLGKEQLGDNQQATITGLRKNYHVAVQSKRSAGQRQGLTRSRVVGIFLLAINSENGENEKSPATQGYRAHLLGVLQKSEVSLEFSANFTTSSSDQASHSDWANA